MSALGPAYFVAYAITGGEPFEPYPTRRGGYHRHEYDLDRMWQPDDATRCPLLNIGSGGVEFHRCYTGLVASIVGGGLEERVVSSPEDAVIIFSGAQQEDIALEIMAGMDHAGPR